MKLGSFLKNKTLVSIVSADFWGSIRILNQNNITIHHIQTTDDLSGQIIINSKDLPAVASLLEKRGDLVSPLQKFGPAVIISSIKKRPVLLGGIFFLMTLFLYLPSRVLYLQVDGNHFIPDKQILSAAESAGIRLWAARKDIRSEKAKNQLLSAIPQLQWAGVNTYGSKAVITVQERSVGMNPETQTDVISSIVASQDGIIQSATVQSGTILCHPNQAVKAGQILISGYTDCGICLKACRAEGEVYAQTVRKLSIVTPDTEALLQVRYHKKNYSLILGKKRINFWKGSGISDTGCGRIYKEYRLTLPGGYTLPFAVSCETDIFYNETSCALHPDTLKAAMLSYSKNYLNELMIAGTVQNVQHSFSHSADLLSLAGVYRCTEMIGREHLEIGAPYE